ncbi:hypothetical protein ACFXMT_14205 [Streptomyces mirabilis]|uniref:hypothetical protein n=1 Tax=Streptomyces mirabilis TaxID=68239 RepID=UPI00367C3981
MALRMMNGPEPLFRLKVVKERAKANPEYTGYGCGVPPYLGTGELYTEYYGPYVRRHAATTMQGKENGSFVVSAVIETCQPEWTES